MSKDNSLNSVLCEYNKLAKEGRKITETTTFVSGAVSVGTARVIKDFVCEVLDNQATGEKTPWLAVLLEDGTKISLRSFMGQPSLEGFTTSGSLPVDEFTGAVLPSGEKEVVTTSVVATCDLNDLKVRYTPKTWGVNDFLNNEAPKLKGATVTYHGTALKPYVVRRPFGNQVPGGNAAITVHLWTVENAPTPVE